MYDMHSISSFKRHSQNIPRSCSVSHSICLDIRIQKQNFLRANGYGHVKAFYEVLLDLLHIQRFIVFDYFRSHSYYVT